MNLPGEEFDRGIQKWGGFILSEHSEQIEHEKKHLNWKEAMSAKNIEMILSEALLHQQTVIIQQKLPVYNPDGFPEADLIGRIVGIQDGDIWLRSGEKNVKVFFDSIHHVACKEGESKWYT
ncbi:MULTISPECIES: hypothetical protein [Listeria]|uniref:hypothetical protein n=1 Tax=Listeria TaxID=1637 RepID=UPI000B593038|nr:MULTISPECIES: hypothetical protein [Listeria]